MAARIILVDDIDGSENDVQPVSITIGETTYSMDLSKENREAFLAAVSPFITPDATPTKTERPAKRSGVKYDPRASFYRIRDWTHRKTGVLLDGPKDMTVEVVNEFFSRVYQMEQPTLEELTEWSKNFHHHPPMTREGTMDAMSLRAYYIERLPRRY